MTDQASKDATAKAGIIEHMNADHQNSLSYYLRHYCSLTSHAAFEPRLRDITFESMTVQTSDGKYHVVLIDPPMKSWSEAPERAVEMDREARLALDISEVSATE